MRHGPKRRWRFARLFVAGWGNFADILVDPRGPSLYPQAFRYRSEVTSMRTKFITTATGASGFPETELAEIAFVGRSNVGKSSLLNRLANAKIARTSKTPGRTQAVNFFTLADADGEIMLADLPGYGYARAPKSVQVAWYGLIESYLSTRTPLSVVLQLIDIRRGVQDEEREVHRWLVDQAGPNPEVLIVATKADKLGKAKIKPALGKIARDLGVPLDAVIACSSHTGAGIDALRDHLLAPA